MTESPLRLTCFIGTQRVAGAGQNARLKQSSFHVAIYTCPGCGHRQNLEEDFPRCIRLHGETRRRKTVRTHQAETVRESRSRILDSPIRRSVERHDERSEP